MKQIVHFCLSSHREVMYRDEADQIWGFNCLALAALITESSLLADGIMSTHLHGMAQTDSPRELIKRSRYAYTRYFNAKYHRRGRLAEHAPFFLDISGINHLTIALNYVNRQGLHHGISTTPFGYRHCSANAFFRAELGKPAPDILMPDDQRSNYLPDRAEVPSSYRMSKDGLLLREDILDTNYVEQIYLTPRNFLYQMNRLTDEKWVEEQKKDKNNLPPVTLEQIERGTAGFDVAQLLKNENARMNPRWMTDLELCHVIDTRYVPQMSRLQEAARIYDLPLSKRRSLFDVLSREIPFVYKKQVSLDQLGRCLCLSYE